MTKKLIGATFCSGIGTPELAAPQIDWRFASEIEKFPRAVLQHRFGAEDVRHGISDGGHALWGDFTTVRPRHFRRLGIPLPDIMVAGTPCQSFSIAGLRQGLKDPRGNLTLEFLVQVRRFRPTLVLLENVPGILSDDDGETFRAVVAGFNEVGYLCDVDIHDAQDFGLAQRRERVYFACVRFDDLRNLKTTSSARIMAECLAQILQGTWDAIRQAWWPEGTRSGLESPTERSINSLKEKIKSFENLSEELAFTQLLKLWGEHPGLFMGEQDSSACHSVPLLDLLNQKLKMGTSGFASSETENLSGWQNIELLWKESLDAAFAKGNESTTSISIDQTTDRLICTFAIAAVNIARSIIDWVVCFRNKASYPDFWNLVSSLSTMTTEIINCATQSSGTLFAWPGHVDDWRLVVNEAHSLSSKIDQYFRETSADEILPVAKGLQRHTPPRREKGEGAARGFEVGPGGGGFTDVAPTLDCRAKNGPVQNQIGAGVVHAPEIARCVATREGSSQDYETTTMLAVSVTGDVAHTLKAEGADASEDGTGRGTPVVCIHADAIGRTGDAKTPSKDAAGILRIRNPGIGIADDGTSYNLMASGQPHAVTVAIRGREGGATAELGGEVATALRASQGGGDKPHVLAFDTYNQDVAEVTHTLRRGSGSGDAIPATLCRSAVRRLTPVECERLQGLPDNWTLIPWRGNRSEPDFSETVQWLKSHGLSEEEAVSLAGVPDGPRYKAIGNGMAKDVLEWILGRLTEFMPDD